MMKRNTIRDWWRGGRRMPHVRVASLVLEVRRESVIWRGLVVHGWCAHIIIVVVIQITSTVEVGRTFVLMSCTILYRCQSLAHSVSDARTYILKAADGLVDVSR